MTDQELIDDLALRIAKRRTNGAVYMDGKHNPLPSEQLLARQFVEDLKTMGWMTKADLGQADWIYDFDLERHVPCCTYCGKSPLTGDQILKGECGEH